MDELRVRLGKRLRDTRKAAGLSQELLAEKAGISVDFISMIERGKRSPSIETIEKLSKALHIEISDLFVELHSTG